MTDGKKAIAAKAEKIAAQREAYKELLTMAKEQRTEELRIAEGKPSGKQVCDIDLDTIYWMGVKYQNPRLSHDNRTREDFFNEFLCEMVDRGDFNMGGACVKDPKEIEKESRVIRLALTAGANPNGWYENFETPIFDAFIEENKFHGALLVAETPGFYGPECQSVFDSLDSYLQKDYKWEFPGKAEIPYARKLVYALFSKGIKPYDPKIRKSLQVVYEQEKKAKANASKLAGNAPQGGRSGTSR